MRGDRGPEREVDPQENQENACEDPKHHCRGAAGKVSGQREERRQHAPDPVPDLAQVGLAESDRLNVPVIKALIGFVEAGG